MVDSIEFQLADLPGVQLGHALGSTVTIDVDAAGYGWFIDATAKKSVEFETVVSGTR